MILLGLIYYVVRDFLYKNRFDVKSGNRVDIPASAQRELKKIKIKVGGKNNRLVVGENARLTNCEIRLDGDNNLIEIGAGVKFRSGKIYLRKTSNQYIRIGADTTIENAYLLVDEASNIDIGKDCMLSAKILIRTGDKHSILDMQTGKRINPSCDVRIADRVWIGREAQVLKGAVLQSDTVVGACSVVTRAFDRGNCVIAGAPAKVVREGIRWSRELI